MFFLRKVATIFNISKENEMKKLTTLKAEMVKQNISSLKLSQELGINSCVFSLYLNGWRKMPDCLKEEVSGYLKVEPKELFED